MTYTQITKFSSFLEQRCWELSHLVYPAGGRLDLPVDEFRYGSPQKRLFLAEGEIQSLLLQL
jgi:hypothetical protein